MNHSAREAGNDNSELGRKRVGIARIIQILLYVLRREEYDSR